MKIFKDQELKQPIEVFDFGIVEAGSVEEFKYYLVNDSYAELKNLTFFIDHPEIKVIEAPIDMPAKAIAELIIRWTPSITLKQGLQTRLRVSGMELWG